jgi:uncharacterized radical SAM protein YgiQ
VKPAAQPDFLPTTRQDMARLGWDELDVLLVTGDAYIDHPAFGAPLLGRWLCAHGYRTGIIAQPRWDGPADFARMGRPRLFAGVTAGALDSMLAHYTAFRKKRHDDAYTPGGIAGARPNRAILVYTGLVRSAFPGLPVVIGGIEASMRRAAHYDFWSDSIRRSVLLDSKADLLVYGMAENALLALADRLQSAAPDALRASPELLRGIRGTVFATGREAWTPPGGECRALPSFEEIERNPDALMQATLALEDQVHQSDIWATQRSGERCVVLAPPEPPLDTAGMDALYGLPFSRLPHPSYREPIPAEEMIRFSVTTHRGCGGGCTFCSLSFHQGRRMSSRSRGSITGEIGRLTKHPKWDGALTDVGGPSANMWGARCSLEEGKTCRRASCLHPAICGHFRVDQAGLARLLLEIARLPGVRHVRTASGVRYDLALRDPAYVRALVGEFTGGQLKIAPEHCVPGVLDLMRKPAFEVFEQFLDAFQGESAKAGKTQYVVPYLISGFPGCTDADMRALGAWLRHRGWRPQQVQCFVPTPGTVATAMFWSGKDPAGKPIHVARTDAGRLRQHGILTGPVVTPRPAREGGTRQPPQRRRGPRTAPR